MNYNFRESKLVFFEGGSSDEFVPKIQAAEKKIQTEKEKSVKTKDEKKEDIVKEEDVKIKIVEIESKIKGFSGNEKYKKQLEGSFDNLLDERGKDLEKVDAKKEDSLKKLFGEIVKDLAEFDQYSTLLQIKSRVEEDIKGKQLNHEQAAKNLESYYDYEQAKETFSMIEAGPGGLLKQKTQKEVGDLMESYSSSKKELVQTYEAFSAVGGVKITASEVEKFMKTSNIPTINVVSFIPEQIKDEKVEQKEYQRISLARPDLFDLIAVANLTASQKREKENIVKSIEEKSVKVVMRKNTEMFAPKGIKDYEDKIKVADESLIDLRRSLYLQTGDEKYKKSFEESQGKIIETLESNGDKAIDDAASEDDKGKLVLEWEIENKAKSTAKSFAAKFDMIQKLQVTDPVIAYELSVSFIAELKSWKGDFGEKTSPLGGSLGGVGFQNNLPSFNEEISDLEFIKGLKGKPAMFEVFSSIVNKYSEQTEILKMDVLTRNPKMTQFQDDFARLFNSTQPFIKSTDNLMNQLSGDGRDNEISKMFLEKFVYPDAINVLQNEFIAKLMDSSAAKMIQDFKDKGIESPLINKIEKQINDAKHYIENLKETASAALAMKGAGSGALDAFIAGGKKLLKIAVMVAATYFTGGLAGVAGITGFGALAVTAFGGAVGGALGEGMMEGNWQGFETKNLLESWCMGTVTMGAGGAIGDLAGKGLGKLFSNLKDTSMGRVLGIGKYADKYLKAETASANGLVGTGKDFFKRAGGDVKTMAVSEGLLEMAGKDHPVLGFVLSSLAFVHGGMKEAYVSGQRLKIKNGMTVMAEEGKLAMEYASKEEAVQFLRENKATPEMVASFEKTGKLEMKDEGLAVKIVPKDRLMSEARECLETMNKLKEKMFDMDVARKQVSEGTMTLAEYKAKVHEVQNQAQETIKAIREELHGGDKDMSIADLYKKYLQDSNMPLEQQQMIISTISHMVRIREDSFNFESDLVLDPLGSKEEALKARLVAAGTVATNFEGNIVYKMIDGVLCIRCESERDYAKFFGNIEAHTSTGLALSASESGLGIGIIVVKPHVDLSIATPVIVHELQHIYKQGSNPREPEMAEHGKLLQSVREEDGSFSVLTADGEVKVGVIQTYLLAKKAFYEHRFKDEVLAFLVTQGRSLNSVAKSLLRSEGSYDYLGDAGFREGAFKELGIDKAKSFAKDPNLLDRTFHNELNAARDNYFSAARDIVSKVQDAVDFMRDNKGMTETAAREYLRDYLMFADLSKWEFYLNNLM
nr:hypothetical protein [Candidatus Gracilibacteria bacterium]